MPDLNIPKPTQKKGVEMKRIDALPPIPPPAGPFYAPDYIG
jgi:hypothetical protein